MLTHGSLFSGIGGFDLGFERAGFKTIWEVEIDPYCQAVLAKHFPDATRYTDIRSVHGVLAHASRRAWELQHGEWEAVRNITSKYGKTWPLDFAHQCGDCLEQPTVLTGGFPCQPFSVAGKRRGISDDRWLWPEMHRVIEEVRPRWVVAENVPGLIKMALDSVLSDLEALGYTVGAVTIPACAVDAPHRRERVFILAHTNCRGLSGSSVCEEQSGRAEALRASEDVADAERVHAQRQRDRQRERQSGRESGWSTQCRLGLHPDGLSRGLDCGGWECGIPRVITGQANRVQRLKALGNAVVPQLAEEIAWMIRGVEECSATGSGGF